MSTPPTLPADMLWHCPIGGGTCRYAINLFSPSDDNLRHVSYDNTNYLLNEDWKCNDEQLMMVFYEMVNAHWEEHLRELDIKHVRHNNTVSHSLWIGLLTSLSTLNRVLFNGYTLRNSYIP